MLWKQAKDQKSTDSMLFWDFTEESIKRGSDDSSSVCSGARVSLSSGGVGQARVTP